MLVLKGLRIDNNLYTQIGLILLIALSAKNAILIVEVAREHRVRDKRSVIDAAVDAARARFRPILMTSFAFILGVAPLVVASGAGASARKSIGITVFSGMIASTCLAVLFVPSLFVVVQRFEEWRAARKHPRIQRRNSRPMTAECGDQSQFGRRTSMLRLITIAAPIQPKMMSPMIRSIALLVVALVCAVHRRPPARKCPKPTF